MSGQDIGLDHRVDYEAVAVGQSLQVLGPGGNTGDVLQRIIIDVITVATADVSIRDGAAGTDIVLSTGGANLQEGTYSIEIGARARATANGGWRVTTGAGATVLAVGRFT